MKIYTSYFARAGQLKRNGIEPICIAVGTPKYFTGCSYKRLAPRRDMLYMNEQMYRREFANIMAKLNPQQVLIDLKRLAGRVGNVALCCYEKPSDFCHRHLVAEWLNQSLGIEVVEYEAEQAAKTKNEKQATQQSLF